MSTSILSACTDLKDPPPPWCPSRQQDLRSEGSPSQRPSPAGGGLPSAAPSVRQISREENPIPPSLPALHAWTSALTVPWAAEYAITLFGLADRTQRSLSDCEGKRQAALERNYLNDPPFGLIRSSITSVQSGVVMCSCFWMLTAE